MQSNRTGRVKTKKDRYRKRKKRMNQRLGMNILRSNGLISSSIGNLFAGKSKKRGALSMLMKNMGKKG